MAAATIGLAMSHAVAIPQSIKDSLKDFRFKRRNQGGAAYVVKIDKKNLVMVEDELYEDISIEDLAEELPENSPRYVVLSYELKHDDGRRSFPMILVNWAPATAEIGFNTLHAGALNDFKEAADVSKVIEVRDGAEGLTKEILDSRLR